jgi:biopolymer transport protein ExbD
MAENRRMLDIWIVETNTAYRAVPFETVANWLQQGRLLAEDRVRPAGAAEWFRIDSVRALAVYLPQSEPQRIDDRAEALEPVEAEFSWRRPQDEEDEDPDMIPLIDISLVLLIFFMMTAAIQAGLFSPIETPTAIHQLLTIQEGTYFVAIDSDSQGKPSFALGLDNQELEKPAPDMSAVSARLKKELAQVRGEVRINMRAHKALPIEVIRAATMELQRLETEVNDPRLGAKLERVRLHIAGEVSSPAN